MVHINTFPRTQGDDGPTIQVPLLVNLFASFLSANYFSKYKSKIPTEMIISNWITKTMRKNHDRVAIMIIVYRQ